MTTAAFQKKILDFYAKNGRSLPWRRTRDPYRILVSEVMLQQTQTHRVEPKYAAFLKKFPTIRTLAQAPLRDVLAVWQGLGYNRRARNLHRAAQSITARFPRTYEQLLALPGVGPYTAGAVMAFAFNKPVVMIETNIRTVFLHEFFPSPRRSLSGGGRAPRKITDTELLPLIAKTLPKKNIREWYYALMDYGSFLKQKHPNPSRRSAHHAMQSKFEGSDRQIRGRIIRALVGVSEQTKAELRKAAGTDEARFTKIAAALIAEGLLTFDRGRYRIR